MDFKQNALKNIIDANLLRLVGITSTILTIFPGAKGASPGNCLERRRWYGAQEPLARPSSGLIAFINMGRFLSRPANVNYPCVGWRQHANISEMMDGRGVIWAILQILLLGQEQCRVDRGANIPDSTWRGW